MEIPPMFDRFLGKLLSSRKAPAKARPRSGRRFVSSFEQLEDRLSPASASPTNVNAISEAIRNSLSASLQQATQSQSYQLVNGAADLNPAAPSAEVWTDKLDYHPNSTA